MSRKKKERKKHELKWRRDKTIEADGTPKAMTTDKNAEWGRGREKEREKREEREEIGRERREEETEEREREEEKKDT